LQIVFKVSRKTNGKHLKKKARKKGENDHIASSKIHVGCRLSCPFLTTRPLLRVALVLNFRPCFFLILVLLLHFTRLCFIIYWKDCVFVFNMSSSSSSPQGDIVIIGAGLVGSLLGYILTKKGFSVSIFERYGDIRQIPSLGRSINLVITNRGLRACDAIGGGLREELLEALAVRVTGRVLHQSDGSEQFQRYGKDDIECNYSINR
jgi:hypothetical protein